MEKNFLILRNNLLYSVEGKPISKSSVSFLEEVNEGYFVIETNPELSNKTYSKYTKESFSNSDLLVTLEPSSDSIKKIKGNLLILHLDRKNYQKITYPVFIQTSSLTSFLESKNYTWNLKEALSELSYAIVSN